MLNESEIIDLDESQSIAMTGQVFQAVAAGLPLESGLRALAEQTRSRRTRAALLELSERLEQGTPLAEALRECRSDLPPSMNALVTAGLETGRLDVVMRYSVEQSQRAVSLRRQIWLFLSYPMFIVWFSMLVCGGILLRIGPPFKKIFDDFGTELPDVTNALIRVSSTLQDFGGIASILILVVIPGAIVGGVLFGLSPQGQRYSTSIPLIGIIFRYAALTDLCWLLGFLVESGITFPKALRLAGAASNDLWLNRKCHAIAHKIENGTETSEAAMQANFPIGLSQAFRSANSERSFSDALRGLADVYAAQCFVSSQLATAVVAPISVAFAVSFVVITAIALFLPLIKLLNDLS